MPKTYYSSEPAAGRAVVSLGPMIRCFVYALAVVGAIGCKADRKEAPVVVPPPAPSTAPVAATSEDAGGRGPLGRTDAELAPLRASILQLAPLHVRASKPKAGEWNAEHPELGEIFEQYLNAHPITPTSTRAALVVQPLGDLGKENERVVATTARGMEAFFGLPTRVATPLSLRIIPTSARRGSRGFGEQLLSSRVRKELAPRLPSDAMAFIGFTSNDLWPGEGWNFVFGEASLDERVGVWSLARNGNPSASDGAYRLALLRALKIAWHETGHMFGMHHCTAYRCNMAGVNSLEESDAQAPWLCPECLAKLSWATSSLPEAHLKRMLAFSRENAFADQASYYAKALEALDQRGVAVPSK